VAKVPDNLKFEPRDSLALYEAMLAALKQGKEGEAVKARADALAQVIPNFCMRGSRPHTLVA
jgi:hypothetical protein